MKHQTEEAYSTLTGLRMEKCPTLMLGDEASSGTQWLVLDRFKNAWVSICEEAARDILTMHALRWLESLLEPVTSWWFFENEHGKAGPKEGWAIRTLPKHQVIRKDYYGEDLLDAICEAAKAIVETA